MLALDGSPVESGAVRRMSEAIRHRGPDDSGYYSSDVVAFGFRRLAILDLSPAGHQPMISPDGNVALVFNGEIYNYRELRAELSALGHEFQSNGDTEVLLHAYLEWGADCVGRLNGMWSFVLHDKNRRVLFGSRDRFGIKPMFLHRSKRAILIASEIKALSASGLVERGTDWSVAADFLLAGRLDHSRHTFHKNVEQLPAGCCFEADLNGRWKEWRYWSVDDVPRYQGKDPARDFADLFEDAIRLHMRSDVPVGVHLSGGLDSTSILCAAAKVRGLEADNRPIQALSFIAREFDESAYIEETTRYTGARLFPLENDAERFWRNLKDVLWCQDEPFHSPNLLVGYELMRLSAKFGVKVVLNGQGADETLAGYSSYFREFWSSQLIERGVRATWREMAAYSAIHSGSAAGLFASQLGHLGRDVLARSALYRAMSDWRNRRRLAADDWYEDDLTKNVSASRADRYVGLAAALKHSIYCEPLPLYLRVEDRISMAHSIESRVPFLDYRLVSFAFGLPADWLMRGPWNKFVLREAMKGRIPESVRTRPIKFGFPVPSRSWWSGPLYEPVRDIIASRACRERGVFKTKSILRDLDRHRRGEIDVAGRLFDVVQFETWSQMNSAASAMAPTAEGPHVA